MNKAADLDNTVPEIIKALPFEACREINKLFNEAFFDETDDPKTWELVSYGAIPKDGFTEQRKGLRWIAKIKHFRQWYVRTWRERLETKIINNVNTYGLQHRP